MAVKSFKPEEFSCAIYEILNSSRLYEIHPNVINLRGVDYELLKD